MAVLEKSTISCFFVKRGNKEELPPIFEGGLGILVGFWFLKMSQLGPEVESALNVLEILEHQENCNY